MPEDTQEFTNLGLKKRLGTKLKIAMLARALGVSQYVLVDMLVNSAWIDAKNVNIVTDEALEIQAHWVGGENDEYTEEDVDRIMKVLRGKK